MIETSIDKKLHTKLREIEDDNLFVEGIFVYCESQEDRERLLTYIKDGHTDRIEILSMASQIGIESGIVEGELVDEDGRIVNCTLTGDALNEELLLFLNKISKDEAFSDNIYNMLQNDKEKQAMILFLNEPRNIFPQDVEMKALDITGQMNTIQKKITDFCLPEDPPGGLLFANPKTLPGEYRPADIQLLKEASEYAKKVKEEEHRDVTFEEMQQFTIRSRQSL